MVRYRIVSDIENMIDEVDRIGGPPSFRRTRELEAVLRNTFLQTQEDVHVLSGALQASGRTSSDLQRGEWIGEIIYGGSDSEAYYGVYEWARGDTPTRNHPEGQHDFFRNVHLYYPAFEEVIGRHFIRDD